MVQHFGSCAQFGIRLVFLVPRSTEECCYDEKNENRYQSEYIRLHRQWGVRSKIFIRCIRRKPNFDSNGMNSKTFVRCDQKHSLEELLQLQLEGPETAKAGSDPWSPAKTPISDKRRPPYHHHYCWAISRYDNDSSLTSKFIMVTLVLSLP